MNLKKEQTSYTIQLIIGICVVAGGLVFANISGYDKIIFATSGFGGVWIAISIIRLYLIKMKPKKYEEKMIDQSDERSIAIRGYAGYATFLLSMFVTSIMTLIFALLDYTFLPIIGGALMLMNYIIFILSVKYYNKKI